MHPKKILFLIGAPKCATTSFVNWLGSHPEIYNSPIKEPGFFRSGPKKFVLDAHHPEEIVTISPESPMCNLKAYLRLFEKASPEQWVCDASTDYLSDHQAVKSIHHFAKGREVKVICILRDPIERAFSEYKHTLRDGAEPLSFKEAIMAEAERKKQNYQPLFFHIKRSLYFESVQRFRQYFGNNLLILDYKTLSNYQILAKQVCYFLDIRPIDLGELPTLNISEKSPGRLRELYPKIKNWFKLQYNQEKQNQKLTLTEEESDFLFNLLKNDIESCVKDPYIPTDNWSCVKRYRLTEKN